MTAHVVVAFNFFSYYLLGVEIASFLVLPVKHKMQMYILLLAVDMEDPFSIIFYIFYFLFHIVIVQYFVQW